MSEQKLSEEWEEQAAAYVLGALAPEDRSKFARGIGLDSHHLAAEADRLRAVADQLAFAVHPVNPRPSLRERLLAHLSTEADRETQSFDGIAGSLGFAVTPMRPPAGLRDRVLHTLGPQRHRAPHTSMLTFVRSGEGQWQPLADGVTAKILHFDPISQRATALVRMAPGARYAPHRHAEAEELYVLEGGCFCGGQELFAGDYHRAEAGTEHHDTSSDDGCLLLVISSPHNEMLG